MRICKATDVKKEEVDHPEAKDVQVRWLIGQDSPAPVFWMRRFEIAPGGHTPLHNHDWEHEVYILQGRGVVNNGETETPVSAGHFVLVMPKETHQFKNTGSETLIFLCLIPKTE